MVKTIALFLVICFTTIGFAQTDVENGKDYYLLDRMPNYYISKYFEEEYGDHRFVLGSGNVQIIEGKKTVINYKHKEYPSEKFVFPSNLQILKNYTIAIEKAGGTFHYKSSNNQHAYYSFKANGKTIYIDVHASKVLYKLKIIEQQPMRQDIVIDADLIKNKIEVEGKIAIYGIYFDTGKSEVKPESKPSLEQIAQYLKVNPKVNCWVVGHTDTDGSFEVNSKLSLDRAKAIKVALAKDYNVNGSRLFAEGVGPLSPVANNKTDEGKKLNRRVELVKK